MRRITLHHFKKSWIRPCHLFILVGYLFPYYTFEFHYNLFLYISEETGLSISKHCAVGPCNLGDENQYTALGLHCDKSKPTWNCASCCTEDACNFGSGQSPLVSRRELAAAMAVVVVMCHMWSLV